MEKYKFFEHTADAKFQAYGKTLEEAFSNAALAMFSTMVDTSKIKPAIMKKIVVEGKNEEALLYNWLEELLFFLDSELFILNSVKKFEISKATIEDEEGEEQEVFRASVVVMGDTSNDTYELKGEVKAVTYNEMKIVKEEDKVMVQVVVDL
ncbi:MAG: archease [Nanoarchaeota archaeon]|nr:archease [Nanoarchaeota archaeon]